ARKESGEIVIKDKYIFVGRIRFAGGPFVAGAHVACGIVTNGARSGDRFDRALPGTLGAMRRDQNPFASERIESPMRTSVHVGGRHQDKLELTSTAPE